jgi:hypothetical protein
VHVIGGEEDDLPFAGGDPPRERGARVDRLRMGVQELDPALGFGPPAGKTHVVDRAHEVAGRRVHVRSLPVPGVKDVRPAHDPRLKTRARLAEDAREVVVDGGAEDLVVEAAERRLREFEEVEMAGRLVAAAGGDASRERGVAGGVLGVRALERLELGVDLGVQGVDVPVLAFEDGDREVFFPSVVVHRILAPGRTRSAAPRRGVARPARRATAMGRI